MVSSDMTFVNGNLHTVLRLSYGISHVDGDLCGKSLSADIIGSLRIVVVARYCAGGFGTGFVDSHIESQ